MYQTHGTPQIARWSVDTAGGRYDIPQKTIYLQLTVHSGTVRVYFDQETFDADSAAAALPGTGERILELAAATTDYFEGPAKVDRLWLRGVGGAAVVSYVSYSKAV